MDELIAPLEWYTEQRKVSDLIPYSYNPRKRTPERIQKLKESLEKFNLVEIPAINLDNTIIAGHQRVFALFEIGRGEDVIDVRVPNRPLSEEELKEYNIRSNVAVGEWDIDLLLEHFSEFNFDDLGLSLDFEIPDDILISNESEIDFEPVVPESSRTVSGDVYELHSLRKGIVHRIVCGDSTNPEDYKKLFGTDKIDLLVTDPPYNVDYQGGTKDAMKIKNDNLGDKEFYNFLFDFFSNTYKFMNPGAASYVFYSDLEAINFRTAMIKAGFKISSVLIWVKNQFVLGRLDYHMKHEPILFSETSTAETVKVHDPILYGWNSEGKHNWYSDRKQSSVLEFDKPKRNAEHPTMKPLDLIVYLIKNSSKQKQLVADLFIGSGTTLVACEQTWRVCRGMELDTKFADVTIDRWVKYMQANSLDYVLKLNGERIQWEAL